MDELDELYAMNGRRDISQAFESVYSEPEVLSEIRRHMDEKIRDFSHLFMAAAQPAE